MKLYRILIVLLLLSSFIACSPEDEKFIDNNNVDLSSITGIKLKPNHYEVLADGKAILDLNPVLYKEEQNIPVLSDRVKGDWIEYFTADGKSFSRTFNTNDKNLIGKEFEVYAKVNGIESEKVKFTVKAPLDLESIQEITFPVVFHIVQTEAEIRSYGGKIPSGKIDKLIKRMNDVFSGTISNSPVGIDTKIRFKAALYDPQGRQLIEPGINRKILEADFDHEQEYNKFILANSDINWANDKYLNIWVFTDGKQAYKTFAKDVTTPCVPSSFLETTDLTNKPEGITADLIAADSIWQPNTKDYGLKIKSNLLNNHKRTFNQNSDNDFMHYLGMYFGLIPTYNYSTYSTVDKLPTDYCNDTFSYQAGDEFYKKNKTTVKEVPSGNMFVSENIMDDQTGLHKSVSQDQLLRIRWVIENCEGRFAWKSDFALTGE